MAREGNLTETDNWVHALPSIRNGSTEADRCQNSDTDSRLVGISTSSDKSWASGDLSTVTAFGRCRGPWMSMTCM